MRDKIGFFTAWDAETGVGRYVYNIANHIEPKLFLCDKPRKKVKPPGNIDFERIETGYSTPIFQATINGLTGGNTQNIPTDFDLYHFSSPKTIRLSRKLESPIVLTIHDLFPKSHSLSNHGLIESYYFNRDLKYIERKVDTIIADSESTKADIEKYVDASNIRVEVVHLGVDHDRFKPRDISPENLGLPSDKKIVLHVGTELKRKNISRLLDAFSEAQQEIEDILLARVGPKTQRISRQIEGKNLHNTVYRTGIVPSEELHYYYNAADLCIFPSLHEGFGNPALEALASGCPLITSNQSSLPEIVGDAAVKVNPESIEEMKNALVQMVQDPDERAKYREKGLERSKEFSWKKTARETEEMYQKTIDEASE